MDDNRANEIASERFMAIAPLLEGRSAAQVYRANKAATKDDLASRPPWSARTLNRHKRNFELHGFEGLKPKPRAARSPKGIGGEVLELAKNLRLQNPNRSVRSIIELLVMMGKVKEGELKRSTLQRWFQRMGVDRTSLKNYSDPKVGAGRFQHPNRNCLWQADIIFGPRVEGKKTYGVMIVDDCTRMVVQAEFYHAQTKLEVEDSFRKAVVKWGVPEAVYCDNGKQFTAKELKLGMAKLGSRIRYAPVRSPRSKGKVERFNRNIHNFFDEFALLDSDKRTLKTLNETLWAWLDTWYQTKPHSALKDGLTPRRAFMEDGKPLRLTTAEKVAEAFLESGFRLVNGSGCFQRRRFLWRYFVY